MNLIGNSTFNWGRYTNQMESALHCEVLALKPLLLSSLLISPFHSPQFLSSSLVFSLIRSLLKIPGESLNILAVNQRQPCPPFTFHLICSFLAFEAWTLVGAEHRTVD